MFIPFMCPLGSEGAKAALVQLLLHGKTTGAELVQRGRGQFPHFLPTEGNSRLVGKSVLSPSSNSLLSSCLEKVFI